VYDFTPSVSMSKRVQEADSDSDEDKAPIHDMFDLEDMTQELLVTSSPLMPITLDDMAAKLIAFSSSRRYPLFLAKQAEALLRRTPNLPQFARDIIIGALNDPARITRNDDGALLAIERVPLHVFYQALIAWLDAFEWVEQEQDRHRRPTPDSKSIYILYPPIVAYWRMLCRGAATIELSNPENVLVALGYTFPRLREDDRSESGYDKRAPTFRTNAMTAATIAHLYGYTEAFELLCGADTELRDACLNTPLTTERALYFPDPNEKRYFPEGDVDWLMERWRYTFGVDLLGLVDHTADVVANLPRPTHDVLEWDDRLELMTELYRLLPDTFRILLTCRTRLSPAHGDAFALSLWRSACHSMYHMSIASRQRFKLARVFLDAVPIEKYITRWIGIEWQLNVRRDPERIDNSLPLRWILNKLDKQPHADRLNTIARLSVSTHFINLHLSVYSWLAMAYSFAVRMNPVGRVEYPQLAGYCIVRAMEELADISDISPRELERVVYNAVTPHCAPIFWRYDVAPSLLPVAAASLATTLTTIEVSADFVRAMVALDARWNSQSLTPPPDPDLIVISPMRLALLIWTINYKSLDELQVALPKILIGFDNDVMKLIDALVIAPFIRLLQSPNEKYWNTLFRTLMLLPFVNPESTADEERLLRTACRAAIGRVLGSSLPAAFMPLDVPREELQRVRLMIQRWNANAVLRAGTRGAWRTNIVHLLVVPVTTTVDELLPLVNGVYGTAYDLHNMEDITDTRNNRIYSQELVSSFADDSGFVYRLY